MRSIVPTAVNEVIGLFKGTSIVYVLALGELFYTVSVIYGRTQRVLPMLVVAAIWYVVLTTVITVDPVLRRAPLRPGRGPHAAADTAAAAARRADRRPLALRPLRAGPPDDRRRPAARPGRGARRAQVLRPLEVLHDVDLVVEPGTVTVVLGPSGSGKSTLLRSINHLEKVDRGLRRPGRRAGRLPPAAHRAANGCTS